MQKLDAGGLIPTNVVNKQVPRQLILLDEIRLTFQRDDDVDAEEHNALAKVIR